MKFIDGHGFGRWLKRASQQDAERGIDEQLENSFPASDPPSYYPQSCRFTNSHAFKSAWNRPGRER